MKKQEIKKGEIIRLKKNINLFDLTLDDKINICKTYGGQWNGAEYCNGVTTFLIKKY